MHKHAYTKKATMLAKCMDIFEMQDKNIFWNLGEVFETFFCPLSLVFYFNHKIKLECIGLNELLSEAVLP